MSSKAKAIGPILGRHFGRILRAAAAAGMDGSPRLARRLLRRMGTMKRRFAPLLAVPLFLALAGCSQVGDAAKGIASEAASQAGSAAVAELREQICTPLQDGTISEQDKQVLSGLLVAAEAAGVPVEYITPLENIAESGDQLPEESVSALQDACGVTSTPTPSN
jgi:hypothetical protein